MKKNLLANVKNFFLLATYMKYVFFTSIILQYINVKSKTKISYFRDASQPLQFFFTSKVNSNPQSKNILNEWITLYSFSCPELDTINVMSVATSFSNM